MDDSQSGEYSGHFAEISSQPPQSSDYSPEADSCVAKISDILNVMSRSPYGNQRFSPDEGLSEEHKVTVPRLRLKESAAVQISNHYLESKSTESINSVGTVIRHETPKRPGTAKQRPPSPYRISTSQRPSSAKRSVSTANQSIKDEIEAISHLTAQDAIHSLHQLVKAKVKAIGDYQLPERDRAEVQDFFQEQKNKFRNELNSDLLGHPLVHHIQTLHDRHKMEAAHRENERHERRREEILEKQQIDEIKRRKKAIRLRRESVESFQKTRVDEIFHKLERQRRADESAQRREESDLFRTEKQLILENIKNFYQDRIQRLRERIEETKFAKKIAETERKREVARAERERKEERKRHLADVNQLLDMQEKLLGKELTNPHFEEQILGLYLKAK